MNQEPSTPKHIRALREAWLLELEWTDGLHVRLPFKLLREECQCARCVDENTGKRLLDPDTVPGTIQPDDLKFTGNYALKFYWSDGHDTGLYTWDHLRNLSQHPRSIAVTGQENG